MSDAVILRDGITTPVYIQGGPASASIATAVAAAATATAEADAAHADRLLADADAANALASKNAAATSATASASSATDALADKIAAAGSATSASTSAGTAEDALDAVLAAIAGTPITTTLTIQAGSRAVLAAVTSPVGGKSAFLSEFGRAGVFVFDSSDLSAQVTADPLQGLFVAPDASTGLADDGTDGAWVRRFDGVLRPEYFGATGGFALGVDDGPALAAMCAWVNATGGGAIDMRPVDYGVGGQTLHAHPGELYTYYNYPPDVLYPIEFNGCTRGVTLRMNGARIKCLPGKRYGSFNDDGSAKAVAPGYVGVGAATPYYAMIYVHDCTGPVRLEIDELDGNILNALIGGPFSDTGIQLQMTGLFLQNNSGLISGWVHSHHHGLDGVLIDGPADDVTSAIESGQLRIKSYCNGRQALSVVGGRGWDFTGSSLSWTGKANPGSDVAGPVQSNPGAGVDFEAEGIKEIRDISLRMCEIVGNYGAGIVADSGTDVDMIDVEGTTLIGTTNYVLWINRPGFRFKRCRIHGTWVNLWDGTVPFKPQDAVVLEDCLHTNDVANSPTGNLFLVNDLLWEGGSGFVAAYRSTFVHARPSTRSLGNAANLQLGNGPRYFDCNFIAKAGGLSPMGSFFGRNWFIEDGGAITALPGAPIAGWNNSGPSESGFYYRTGGVVTQYPASADSAGNRLGILYTGIDANWTFTPGVDKMTIVHDAPVSATRVLILPYPSQTGKAVQLMRTSASTGSAIEFRHGSATGSLAYSIPAGPSSAKLEYIDDTRGWFPTAI